MSKVRENYLLLKERAQRGSESPDVETALADVECYEKLAQENLGRRLGDIRILEIGYGARPLRLIALLACGADAVGVDIEGPILEGSASEFWDLLKSNGFERFVKSAVRHLFFDRRERRALETALRQRQWSSSISKQRFFVGDIADQRFPSKSFDLIISEDVFEHIEAESLPLVAENMRRWIADDGLLLIRPNIYTGIVGAHLLEWSHSNIGDLRLERSTGPWEHLLSGAVEPNSTLNRLSRADFRAVFSRAFVIEDEIVKLPDLGAQYMSPELRTKLSDYPDEELFSNQVLFVLRPR